MYRSLCESTIVDILGTYSWHSIVHWLDKEPQRKQAFRSEEGYIKSVVSITERAVVCQHQKRDIYLGLLSVMGFHKTH